MRVCILARESLLHWPGYFINAFRECCDVVSIGAAVDPANHDYPDWDRVKQYVVHNDIISGSLDACALQELLPEGWAPDLLVVIQSGAGMITGVSELGCPTVYLSIDTWHDPREFVHAHQYDFVFLAQKAMVKYMRSAGCLHAKWLPLGCDPAFHYAATGEVVFDIAFIGSTHFMVNRQRVARLKVLEENFNLGYTYGMGCAEMAEAYGQTNLIFNASIARDVNMRVFEALATGKTLITNREAEDNGLFDLFEDEKHLVTYTDETLIAQVQRCLDNPAWAAKIGKAGRKEVLARHTYLHRVHTLLDTLRDFMPNLGKRAYARIKPGLRIAEFVPFGTRNLLDFGLGLDTSRVALHRQGVQRVTAVAMTAEALEKRANSYDEVHRFAPDLQFDSESFDAIVWAQPLRCRLTLDYVLASSKVWLVEGGRIIIIFGNGEIADLGIELSFNALYRWLLPLGYKLLVWRSSASDSDYHLITACHYRCTGDEIVAKLYQEFPVNGVDTDPGIRLSDDPIHG